jgi:hypothetical protein
LNLLLRGFRAGVIAKSCQAVRQKWNQKCSGRSVWGISQERTHALGLRFYGMADNDLWLTNTNQHIIVDGRTGHVLESTWLYEPEFGAQGWTVVCSPAHARVGYTTQYLVVSSKPLAEVINLPARVQTMSRPGGGFA